MKSSEAKGISPPPSSPRATALAAAAVALLALGSCAASINYGFVFDEQILIRDNPMVHDLGNVGRILTTKFWPGPARGVYYRPMITLSYALGYAEGGDDQLVQHFINIVAHLAASVLAFFLARRIAGTAGVAFLAAALFAVHPVHSESVLWVPGRTDVIASVFMLGSWLALYRGREGTGAPGFSWCAASLVLFILALGSKEIALALPLMVIAADRASGEAKTSRRWIEYLVMAAIAAAFLVWRQHILSGPGADPEPDPLSGLSPAGRIRGIITIFSLALRVIVFPYPYRIDYAWAAHVISAPASASIAYIVLTAAMIIAMVMLFRRLPKVALCISCFIISLLPVSHLVPFPTLFAERFLYLPSLFVCLGLVLLAVHFSRTGGGTKWRRPATVLAALLVALMLVFSFFRGRMFESDLSFWQSAVRQAPDLAVARNWLGIAFRNRGMLEEAEQQYRAAFAFDPGHTVARMNLAEIMMRTGRPDEAVSLLEWLVKIEPENATVRVNLGLAYSMQERLEEAAAEWRRALEIEPGNFSANVMLGKYCLEVKDDPARARAYLQAAEKSRPGDRLVMELLKKAAGGAR